MRSLPNLLILPVILLFSIAGNAQQLTVAKDFNACLYGLIDQNGKWVVPAKYTTISAFSEGCAVVMKDNKYGLLSDEGKEIVPLIYDRITPVGYSTEFFFLNGEELKAQFYNDNIGLYTVQKNNLYGMLDKKGVERVPVVYHAIYYFINGVGVFISADGKQTGFFDLNGVRGILPNEFSQAPTSGQFRGMNVYPVSKRVMIDKKRSRFLYGVINDSARLIIPCEYDSINSAAGFKDIIEVYKNGKTGYFTTSGKKIFDAIYTINGAFRTKVPLLIRRGLVPAYDGKYWGVLGLNGKFLLDFKYDAVNPILDYNTNDTLAPAWEVKQNGNWGILGKKGNWIITPAYSDILYWPLSEKKQRYIFHVKSQTGWGSVTSEGDELMPMIYDTLFTYGMGYLFWSEKSTDYVFCGYDGSMVALYRFDPEKEEREREKQHEKWMKEHENDSTPDPFLRYVEEDMSGEEYFSINDDEKNPYRYAKQLKSVFGISYAHARTPATGDKDYFFCTFQTNSRNRREQNEYILDDANFYNALDYPAVIHKLKNGYELCYPELFTSDSQYTYYFINDESGIIRSDGKLLVKPGTFQKIQRPMSANPLKCIVEGKGYQSMGVITIDGKLVTDTMWVSINSWKGDTISVQSYSKSGPCHGEWNLLDLSSGKLLLSQDKQFIEPLRQTRGIQIVGTSTGVGLYSADKMKFILPPAYLRIGELNYNSGKFIVEKCNGQFGIVNNGGIWETDSCWTSIVCVDHSLTRNYNQVYDGRDKYLLLNDKTWVLYDNVNGQQKATPALANQVFNFAAKQYLHKTNNYGHDDSYCPECPLLDKAYLPVLKSWEADLLFNQLYRAPQTIDHREKLHYSEYGCSCSEKNVKDAVRNKQGYAHVENQLHYATDSCFSFAQGTTSENYYQDKLWESYNPWNHYFYNYFLFADGPHDLTLDSMFTGDAWKTTIANEAMNYLRTHPGIEASCTDPSKYPVMLNHSFLVEAQGLRFFPSWSYKEKGVEFIIPWTTLKPFLRPEIAHKLGFT